MSVERKYGWRKDNHDPRDHLFAAPAWFGDYQPTDLREFCPPVFDQRTLASCTACATTAMVQFVRGKQMLNNWQPSPLFTYYATRIIEGTTEDDAGAQVRNALKSAVRYGVVREELWGYDPGKVFIYPTGEVFAEAEKHQTLEYHRIATSINPARKCLSEGYPFTFGLLLSESFNSVETITTGLVKTPDFANEEYLGGHCMLCVGWKMIGDAMYFIVQNSWGAGWGDKGYCYIPAEYMANTLHAFDFWTIRLEENDEPAVVEQPVVEPEKPIVAPAPAPAIKRRTWLQKVLAAIKGYIVRITKL